MGIALILIGATVLVTSLALVRWRLHQVDQDAITRGHNVVRSRNGRRTYRRVDWAGRAEETRQAVVARRDRLEPAAFTSVGGADESNAAEEVSR